MFLKIVISLLVLSLFIICGMAYPTKKPGVIFSCKLNNNARLIIATVNTDLVLKLNNGVYTFPKTYYEYELNRGLGYSDESLCLLNPKDKTQCSFILDSIDVGKGKEFHFLMDGIYYPCKDIIIDKLETLNQNQEVGS